MWPYWVLYLVPAGFSLISFYNKPSRQFAWLFFGFLSVLIIGMRYEVGSDWSAYMLYLEKTRNLDFLQSIQLNDPGYMALNWISARLGWDMIGVNAVCGIFFITGLLKFARQQPYSWIAVAIAVPYLLNVIVMGQQRQGVAIGFVFWALWALTNRGFIQFTVFVTIGALFHKTAVVVFLLLFVVYRPFRWWHIFIYAPAVTLIGYLLIVDSFENYWHQYVTQEMQSEGATIRIVLNVIPVLLSIFLYSPIKNISPDFKLLKWLSIAALISVPLLITFPSSTVIDRLSLYSTPLQVALWPRLIAVQRDERMRALWAIIILIFYAVILYVWFTYSDNRIHWVPYKFHEI